MVTLDPSQFPSLKLVKIIDENVSVVTVTGTTKEWKFNRDRIYFLHMLTLDSVTINPAPQDIQLDDQSILVGPSGQSASMTYYDFLKGVLDTVANISQVGSYDIPFREKLKITWANAGATENVRVQVWAYVVEDPDHEFFYPANFLKPE